jgi:hypothetical protein
MGDSVSRPRWSRLLDRGRSWGSVRTCPTRYGVTRYTLEVYPPGISRDERVPLRLYRSWPVWGVAGWLLLQLLLAPSVSPGLALALASGMCLAAVAIAGALAGDNRSRVRVLTVVQAAGIDDPEASRQLNEIRFLATRLVMADRSLTDGRIDAVEHEVIVGLVYDRMARQQHRAIRG